MIPRSLHLVPAIASAVALAACSSGGGGSERFDEYGDAFFALENRIDESGLGGLPNMAQEGSATFAGIVHLDVTGNPEFDLVDDLAVRGQSELNVSFADTAMTGRFYEFVTEEDARLFGQIDLTMTRAGDVGQEFAGAGGGRLADEDGLFFDIEVFNLSGWFIGDENGPRFATGSVDGASVVVDGLTAASIRGNFAAGIVE